MIAIVEQAVAIIDDSEILEKITLERILRIVVEDRRGAPDRLRAEACAGPVGNGGIERNAPDNCFRAFERLGVSAPHEGQDARMGWVGGRTGQAAGSDRMVDGL
ncbi:Uncharacterised protein [Brucella abortus]|nr:Uncharacterised protein [Brucella abortus]